MKKRFTDAEARSAKPREKAYKLYVDGGLFLLVNTDGSKWWRFKYRFAKKERLLGLGVYPEVGLKEARDERDNAKRQLRQGIDPSAARKAQKAARVDRAAGSFEVVAREWYEKQEAAWAASHSSKVLRRLEQHVFPRLGAEPIGGIRAPAVLEMLQRIEAAGTVETAHRVKQTVGAVFRYAVATHRADADPTSALKGALAPRPANSFASITDPKEVGELLRAIRGYTGSAVVRIALQLLPLVFVRPGELRGATWPEFSFDLVEPAPGEKPMYPEPQWCIPAPRMKMREQHIVPLSRQALELLRELHRYTGPEGYLFPSIRSRKTMMSANTINAALRGLGYAKDQMVGHGFRHMASTLLHERGFETEWIERQLAHGDRDSVRARYNFAQYLPQRRRMMQEWADYLDKLAAADGKVVSIESARKAG